MLRIKHLLDSCKTICFFLICVFLLSSGKAQNQQKADSFALLLKTKELSESDRLWVLYRLAYHERDSVEKRLFYAEELIALSKNLGNNKYLARGYLQKGQALRRTGDVKESIASFFEAVRVSQAANHPLGVGNSFFALADAYSAYDDHPNAILYYNKAIHILREGNFVESLAKALTNAGDEYFNVNELDTALNYFNEAIQIFKDQKHQIGIAYTSGNIGLVYAKQGKHKLAEEYINKATDILSTTGDRYPIVVYDTYMADIYAERGDWERALKYAHHSLRIAQEEKLKAQIRDASKKLAELYEAMSNYEKAYGYHKQYLIYRDSVINEGEIRRIADLRTEFEVSQKQAEVDLLNEQRRNQQIILWALASILLLVGGLVFVVYRSARRRAHTNQLLSDKNSQIELQRDELQNTNNKLIELDQFKQGMTSMIVHDLKNPLNSIINVSADEKAKQSGKLMLNMVLNILDVEKYEDSAMVVDKTEHSLLDIVQSTIHEVLFLVEQKNIAIQQRIAAELSINADREITERILTNLLTNAIKFSPVSGQVNLNCEEINGDFLKISISDIGPGISEDKQHLVFQKFGQVVAKNSGGLRSTGLGLAFCKLAVEAHGGQIGLHSVVGKGATFWFTLPKGKKNISKPAHKVQQTKADNAKLSHDNQLYLRPFVDEIRAWEVFDTSELEEIIQKIDSQNEEMSKWLEKIEKAIYLCNQELLDEQLNRLS